MIEMTPGAQLRFNHYLDELRRVLMGSPSVDLADVERDVRDHIEAALSQQARPVEESVLDRVLTELGSPSQWLPGEQRPWYRKSRAEWRDFFKHHAAEANRSVVDFLRGKIANGPESYRLAYLSLLVLALGWGSLGVVRGDTAFVLSNVAIVASFILSRAALSLFGAEKLSSGQKWLLYPALLVVYVPVWLVTMFGAAAAVGTVMSQMSLQHAVSAEQKMVTDTVQVLDKQIQAINQDLELWTSDSVEIRANRSKLDEMMLNRDRLKHLMKQFPRLSTVPGFTPMQVACAVIAAAGVNWLLLGLLHVLFPQIVRNIFHPFADRLTRWPGVGLAILGLLMSLGGLAFVG